MTKEEILTLAGAGFTAKQIAALNAVNVSREASVEEEREPEKPEPAKDPEIEKLIAQVTGLKETIQAGNIANSNQPKAQSADDILASIINPPKEGK